MFFGLLILRFSLIVRGTLEFVVLTGFTTLKWTLESLSTPRRKQRSKTFLVNGNKVAWVVTFVLIVQFYFRDRTMGSFDTSASWIPTLSFPPTPLSDVSPPSTRTVRPSPPTPHDEGLCLRSLVYLMSQSTQLLQSVPIVFADDSTDSLFRPI